MGFSVVEQAPPLRERFAAADDRVDQLTQIRQTQSSRQWHKALAGLPLSQRRARLREPDAIAELGAKRIADMLRGIDSRHKLLIETVPSETWLEMAYNRGAAFPVPGMVMSRAKVRYHPVCSQETVGTFRYCPPNNVAQEDAFDLMSVDDARFFTAMSGYASPSAVAIQNWKRMNRPLKHHLQN